MASQTASDRLVETLLAWGVDTIFGIPGDGINGIIEALRIRRHAIRFIQVRHEEAAAFNACAYAKWTGRLGVCIATSGPGGIHLLNGLYDAKLDGQPVLAISVSDKSVVTNGAGHISMRSEAPFLTSTRFYRSSPSHARPPGLSHLATCRYCTRWHPALAHVGAQSRSVMQSRSRRGSRLRMLRPHVHHLTVFPGETRAGCRDATGCPRFNGDRKDGRHFDRALEVLWLAYLALATLSTNLPYATS